ncbi:MAG: dihydroorotase [Gammaproteobacteria bacterium]|nr:dihydroorotase [Gammaproteobacteria bacterium]
MNTLTLLRPDDWHIHLRDGAALKTTVAHAAAQFARAIVMPNLAPPVVSADQALAYRARILQHVPAGLTFDPLMTLYLTDSTPAEEIRRAKAAGVAALKLYPAGVTTNSESGVTAIEKVYPALEAMQTHDLPLLVHGEVTDAEIDIFDREAVFIERVLAPLTRRFPALRIVFEHITTRTAVDFVTTAPATIAATITAHHLLYNRNALLAGGVRPHYYCLPVLKRETDRQALLRAATSGSTKFFLGTDSAPHERSRKETACGCAGSYTAHAAIELYAEAFEQAGALDRLEGFASRFGPDFYRLPRNTGRITLIRQAWDAPESYPLADGTLVPLRAGSKIEWRIRP